MLVNAIKTALEKGSIKRVVFFSDTDIFPEPPYVVIKMETGSQANTRQCRIIVHHKQGMADELEQYTMIEIDELLFNEPLVDIDGDTYDVFKNGYTDITPEPDDNTYFMERLFLVPLPGFQ